MMPPILYYILGFTLLLTVFTLIVLTLNNKKSKTEPTPWFNDPDIDNHNFYFSIKPKSENKIHIIDNDTGQSLCGTQSMFSRPHGKVVTDGESLIGFRVYRDNGFKPINEDKLCKSCTRNMFNRINEEK